MKHHRSLFLSGLLLLAPGCSRDDVTIIDSDSGRPDAPLLDTSEPIDAGPPDAGDTLDASIAFDLCTAPAESAESKVPDLALLEAAPTTARRITVLLRAPDDSGLASCGLGDADEARCIAPASDLMPRVAEHNRRIACFLAEHGSRIGGGFESVRWYERLRVDEDANPARIPLGFEGIILGREVRALASHPLVERVELAPVFATPADECTTDTEDPLPKLLGPADSIGDRVAVIRLRVPYPVPTCSDCTAGELRVIRQLHVTMTRRRSCVLDAVYRTTGSLRIQPLSGSGGIVGSPDESYPLELSVVMTREQALSIASRLDVEEVELTDQPVPDPVANMCLPSDLHPGDCPTMREAPGDKIESASLLVGPGLHRVIILVRGGARPCEILCPGRDSACPERDAAIGAWGRDNLESQRCVRGLIDSLGGAADAPLGWLTNAFEAELEWSQILAVAAHPHVARIQPSSSGETPPVTGTP